jgi:hypothetical protein
MLMYGDLSATQSRIASVHFDVEGTTISMPECLSAKLALGTGTESLSPYSNDLLALNVACIWTPSRTIPLLDYASDRHFYPLAARY